MFDQLHRLDQLDGVLDEMLATGFELENSRQAVAVISATEAARRKLAAVAESLQEALDRCEAYRGDGHVSAKAMVRHVAKLSPGEAAARERSARMARDLSEVAAGLAGGSLGVEQFHLLGRVHANPRVREAMVDAQPWFLKRAERLSFADFELEVRRWERLADSDGAEPANSKNHDARNVTLLQDHFELGWQLKGSFAALQGAAMSEILDHYVAAERLADWEKAKAEHGDATTLAHLPRRESQRRADALWQIFQDAAAADGSAAPTGFVHNVVWSAQAYEEMLRRLAGSEPEAFDIETYRCETIDGVALEPTEAAAVSLVDSFRRVVVDSAGVVIDMGRARRFTGLARTAVRVADHHCPWPGCAVPGSQCEIDHTVDHAAGGSTDPGNGGPFCGRHNRWKQKGFRVWRDPAGEWHVLRPDGSEIE